MEAEMKKPEKFAWDDDPSNDHGWYDAEEMDKYLGDFARVMKLDAYKQVLRWAKSNGEDPKQSGTTAWYCQQKIDGHKSYLKEIQFQQGPNK